MRSYASQLVVPLRLSLVDTHPEISREIEVDADLTLDELRELIQSVYDCFDCGHHLFTDSLDSPGWSRSRRRWGDRWTMIDFRDPTIIDEATAHVGDVISVGAPIYFTHSCSARWVVEIERALDPVTDDSETRARIVSGERLSPFACTRGPYEQGVLVAVLDDENHPDHRALRARIQAAVGPWSSFDPDTFDIEAARGQLDDRTRFRRAHDDSRIKPATVLASLVRELPRHARAGLQAHIAAAGLELPVVVTADEASEFTRPFRWLIERADDGGLPISGGTLDPEFVRECSEALRCDEQRVQRLVTAARQMRLLNARKGRLLAKKSVVAAAETPSSLWTELAQAAYTSYRIDRTARDLLLLGIADGTLRHGAEGLERLASAFELVTGRVHRSLYPRHGYQYGYDYADWDYDEYGNSSFVRSDAHSGDCRAECDCPRVDGSTWHDLVAKSIRDAAASAASDGAVPVAAGLDAHELLAAGVQPEWVEPPRRPVAEFDPSLRSRRDATRAHASSAEFLRSAGDLIELLSLFGLRRLDDGGWVVPLALREFARTTLQNSARPWRPRDF